MLCVFHNFLYISDVEIIIVLQLYEKIRFNPLKETQKRFLS